MPDRTRPASVLSLFAFVLFSFAGTALAQARPASGDLVHDLAAMTADPAVSGHEADLSRWIADQIKSHSPKIDTLGSVTITIGDGAPHRLIVAPIDEPGYVVSEITPDGYLRLQRLPQGGNLPLFNLLHSAQPMLVGNRQGKWVPGAMAGLSVHLQPGRKNLPDMNDIENLYVDVGAASAAEVQRAGIELLQPVATQRSLYQLGNAEVAGNAVGDRFGAAALLELIRSLDASKLKGSVTFAFVTQNWAGARGLVQVLNRVHPDELIFVGRFMPTVTTPAPAAAHGDSGILIAVDKPDAPAGPLGEELKSLAGQSSAKLTSAVPAPLLPRSYLPLPKLPERTVHLSVPIEWPVTPGETLSAYDVAQLVQLLDKYLTGSAPQINVASLAPLTETAHANVTSAPTTRQILQTLIETYGVSDHETNVLNSVKSLLPSWAKPTTDSAGNLILDWGDKSKAPDLVVVAHMDEIGYVVKNILPDGRLDLEDKGGGSLSFFDGHVALVHSADGRQHGAVLELPDGWQKADFKFQDGRDVQVFADAGASNPDDVAKLGIKQGDFITIPKKYVPLLGQRALGRSFDDRVGCTALITAAWRLGPQLNRRVAFVWSTGEELGLLGAASYARSLAAESKSAKYVFAIDTFVSSDSPIESKRFGDGIVGNGFVIRAVDNSNITPLKDVDRLRQLMAAQNIPTQFGVTGGGNDGSAFVPFGTIDVAMGWPLRYSHSPGEIVDIRDVESLSRAVETVARSW